MILIGLAGWGDHDTIYPPRIKPRDKLKAYSMKFPLVEVDSSFYAIQSKERYTTWAEETAPEFQFIIKAYQGMTGHLRGKLQYDNQEMMYATFRDSIQPVIAEQKLKAVLFQYPPWFDCTKANVNVLRETKERMRGIPCALEFRNRSWFEPQLIDKTLAFMEEQRWIHSICDEPQAGIGSVPTVLHPTHPDFTMIRMHGRHTAGWNQGRASNWRDVRYLYDYNDEELTEWKKHIETLQLQTKEICVIFNNNSGGHAAGNAAQLMQLLGIPTSHGLESQSQKERQVEQILEQLDLFD
jgi:uncharacterized protein YecE (DUF72 family)